MHAYERKWKYTTKASIKHDLFLKGLIYSQSFKTAFSSVFAALRVTSYEKNRQRDNIYRNNLDIDEVAHRNYFRMAQNTRSQ